MCGAELYVDFQHVEKLIDEHVITDPVVTRLWIVSLFFSTPLHYHNDGQIVTPLFKKKKAILNVQNAYTTLLWKYLLHRHQEMGAVRIFSNLIRVYLKMQHVGYGIYLNLRSHPDLLTAHETLQKVITLDINDDEEDKMMEL